MNPTVSVVMATYNRSNIIGYAIQSVLHGGFHDWELIVVGDACTDDTERVVQQFNDSRIRFVNLETNFGEQSGPNNTGVELARGKYLAFLNHDDMWLPDHLARSVAILDKGEVDLVFGQGVGIMNPPPHRLAGAACATRRPYEPWMLVPASLWVMRRELADMIGPWTPASEIRVMPSQDWLYRAHRHGARMLADPVLSAVQIYSGTRTNSYRDRLEDEHRYWHARMQSETFAAELLASICGQWAQDHAIGVRANLRNSVVSIFRRLLMVLNICTPSVGYWARYWRKGSFLRRLRRVRGLK